MDQVLTKAKCIIFLSIMVLTAYYPSLFIPLNSVDDSGMYHYLLNTDNFSLWNIFCPSSSGSYYRPIVLSTFVLDKYVWGLEASFMHLENILIHLANTLLLFMITLKASLLLKQVSLLVSFTTALFFAIHPLNTESVNWISGRTDLLAGFFLLLAMCLMLKYPLTWPRSLLAAIFMLMACLAKEAAIFFLPAALLFPFYLSSHKDEIVPVSIIVRRNLPHLLLFSAAGSAYFVFRAMAFSKGDQGVARVLTHVAGTESAGMLTSLRLVFNSTFAAGYLLVTA